MNPADVRYWPTRKAREALHPEPSPELAAMWARWAREAEEVRDGE